MAKHRPWGQARRGRGAGGADRAPGPTHGDWEGQLGSGSREGPTGVPKVHDLPPPPGHTGPLRARRPVGHMGPPKTHSPPGCRDPPQHMQDPRTLGDPKMHGSPRAQRTPTAHSPPRCTALGVRGPLLPPKGTWDPQAHGDPKQLSSPGLCQGSGSPGLHGSSPHCWGAAVMRVPTLLGRRSRGSRGRERALSSPSPWAGRHVAAGTPGRAGEEGSRDTGEPGGRVASPARYWAAGHPVPDSSASPQPRHRALRERWWGGLGPWD